MTSSPLAWMSASVVEYPAALEAPAWDAEPAPAALPPEAAVPAELPASEPPQAVKLKASAAASKTDIIFFILNPLLILFSLMRPPAAAFS